MRAPQSRRDFLKSSTLTGLGAWAAGSNILARPRQSADKLRIALVGVGGRGGGNLGGVAGEQIVALCDVDENRAAGSFKRFPDARRYRDFRVMLEKEENNVDAVVVSTPDHVHAPAAIMAMRMGKHVYCEKPLTWSVEEARKMREVAREMGVATQMGNQGTAVDGFRQTAEVVRSGVIGPIDAVHVWTNRPIWPQGADALIKHAGVRAALRGGKGSPPVPDHLDWDLWLGPAQKRPYDPIFLPFNWRGWWDYGTGALGDMACHTANLPFMALELGSPDWVEADVEDVNPESCPRSATIQFQFPARGDRPAVHFTWYDGGRLPPSELTYGQKLPSSGYLLVGAKGTLFSPNDYGAEYRLFPEQDFQGYRPPEPSLPRSPGHHAEWIAACKGGPPAMSNFDYAGSLTETILLGNVAQRAGRRIEWDAAAMKIPNFPEAERFLRRDYREGWSI